MTWTAPTILYGLALLFAVASIIPWAYAQHLLAVAVILLAIGLLVGG
jgi:hypothetical protein